jgi:Activator of Hsp90 ATPase homolog 1-like protein
MTTMAEIEPIRMAFEVGCSVAHAFDTWTAKTSLWWPLVCTTEGIPGFSVVIEPKVGGRIFERTVSASEIEWGEVTIWDPPKRLGYLWHIMATREQATDVEIVFSPTATGKTKVEITHGGWERLGDPGQTWRERNSDGWGQVLPAFVEACSRAS